MGELRALARRSTALDNLTPMHSLHEFAEPGIVGGVGWRMGMIVVRAKGLPYPGLRAFLILGFWILRLWPYSLAERGQAAAARWRSALDDAIRLRSLSTPRSLSPPARFFARIRMRAEPPGKVPDILDHFMRAPYYVPEWQWLMSQAPPSDGASSEGDAEWQPYVLALRDLLARWGLDRFTDDFGFELAHFFCRAYRCERTRFPGLVEAHTQMEVRRFGKMLWEHGGALDRRVSVRLAESWDVLGETQDAAVDRLTEICRRQIVERTNRIAEEETRQGLVLSTPTPRRSTHAWWLFYRMVYRMPCRLIADRETAEDPDKPVDEPTVRQATDTLAKLIGLRDLPRAAVDYDPRAPACDERNSISTMPPEN